MYSSSAPGENTMECGTLLTLSMPMMDSPIATSPDETLRTPTPKSAALWLDRASSSVAPRGPSPCTNRPKSEPTTFVILKLRAASLTSSAAMAGSLKFRSTALYKRPHLLFEASPVTPIPKAVPSKHASMFRRSTSSSYFLRTLVVQLVSANSSSMVDGGVKSGMHGGDNAGVV